MFRTLYPAAIPWRLLFACVTLALFAGVSAQNTCDDPFSGETPRFSVRFWTQTDFCTRSVELAEIFSGGPPPDGIPPIDDPQFESIEAARGWLQDRSPVIAFALNGDARAYPLAVLTWHEIANDTVGDMPVAVTYCPLCNAGIVYDRQVDGTTLRFGVSGLLRNSDLIMWDDATQSWWQQLTGEGIVGTYTGVQLIELPSLMTSFEAFASRYPDGLVLSRETGYARTYGQNPYSGYDTAEPFLFFGQIDSRLPGLERVLGVRLGRDIRAYPFEALRRARVINDTVGAVPVVALWQPDAASALDTTVIDEGRDVGFAALYDREVEGRVLTFEAREDGTVLDVETGSTWDIFGQAVGGELKGAQLTQLLAAPHFWFAWSAFYPETTVFESSE